MSTTSRYSRCLACGVEVGKPSQRLVGSVEVFGFVQPVELLERVPGGTQPWMSVEEPVQMGPGELL